MKKARLIIVVPCFNEQEVINDTSKKLSEMLYDLIEKQKISADSKVLFVNDGSSDNTWSLIQNLHEKNDLVFGLNLAKNVGHQNALLAGLEMVTDICDISVSIDADLQDDITVIEQMVDKYYDGSDIVFGVRADRTTDSSFKRISAQCFYRIMNVMGANTIYNHADFRLMSRRAMKQLSNYKERNLFLRGLVTELGYKTDSVYYIRKPRTAGESKYPLKKMISFAWQGITSFSIKPISLITFLGLIIILFSIIAFIYTLVSHFIGSTIPGWSSLMISIWFLGGVQLLSVGVIGQYIGKIYIESKERPRYNIEQVLFDKKSESNED